jgi:hypothetical protein
LGNRELSALHYRCKSFFAFARNFFSRRRRHGYASVAVARVERLARRLCVAREMFESLKWTPVREAESAGALACLSRDTDNRRKCGEAAQALWSAMDAGTARATQARICGLNHHL